MNMLQNGYSSTPLPYLTDVKERSAVTYELINNMATGLKNQFTSGVIDQDGYVKQINALTAISLQLEYLNEMLSTNLKGVFFDEKR